MAESKLETLVYCLGQVGGEDNPVITSGSGFGSKDEYTTKGYARYIQEARNVIQFMNFIINYFLASVQSEFEEDPLAFIDSESEEDSLASIRKMKKQWKEMFKEHQKKLREALRNRTLEVSSSTLTPSIEESSNNSKHADEDSSEESSSSSSAKIPRLDPEATSEACAKAPEMELESSSEATTKAPEMELESTSEATVKAPEMELESTSEATAKAPEMELQTTSEAGAKAPEMELQSTSEAGAKAPEMELQSTSEAGAKGPEIEPESISEAKSSSVGVSVESLEFPRSIFLQRLKEFGGVLKAAYQELRAKMGKALDRISPDHSAHDLKGFTLKKMEKFAKWKYAIKTLNYLVPELESKLGELDLDFDKRKENEKRLTDWMYFDDGKRDRKYHHRLLIPMELTVSFEEISAIIWRQMRRYKKIKKSLEHQLPQEHAAFNVKVAHWKYEVLYKKKVKRPVRFPTAAQSDDTYCCVEEMPVDI